MTLIPITTGIVRLSRMRLFPDKTVNKFGKYKATLLMPKSDTFSRRNINMAIADAISVGLSKTWRELFLEHIRIPIKDGDGIKQEGDPFGPECAGHYVIYAHSEMPPDLVDTNLQPITNSDEIYDGIYAHASLLIYPFLTTGDIPSIGITLKAIMKIADGEYIPRWINPVEKAFSGITGVKLNHVPKVTQAKPITKETDSKLIADPVINNDALPWEDENFQAFTEVMKNRTLTLEEFKRLVTDIKNQNDS